MCFARQRRALFEHLNFQECSEFGVFYLPKVLRATTACTFSTSQLPKVLQEWCVLRILTPTCASRHNGVHFFNISIPKKCSGAEGFYTFWLGNVLRATTVCNFSFLICPDGSAPAALASLLFEPPEPQITGKTQWFATFYLFAHLHLLSSDSFSPLIFFLLFFSFLTLLTSAFSFVHIAGSLTSKLPAIM